MNSSKSLTRYKNLSEGILLELNKVYEEFSAFQKKVDLPCPTGCGKCCFKSDIYCAPIELLPMAMSLLERGEALQIYELCKKHSANHCMFMKISEPSTKKGMCSEYQFRPLVCRTFGVAGRHDKNGQLNYSVCTTLREENPDKYVELLKANFKDEEVAFIDDSKSKLANFDPAFLEQEFPINEALAIILEKVLFLQSLDSGTDDSSS